MQAVLSGDKRCATYVVPGVLKKKKTVAQLRQEWESKCRMYNLVSEADERMGMMFVMDF